MNLTISKKTSADITVSNKEYSITAILGANTMAGADIYSTSFTNGDLDPVTGLLTVTHGLNRIYLPSVIITNNSGQKIEVPITKVGAIGDPSSILTAALLPFMPIIDTYYIVVVG